jgi:hypothetical protein
MLDEKPDDVGASIADAWDELEAKDTPAPEPEPEVEGRPRDEHGRFAPKEKQPEETAPPVAPLEEKASEQTEQTAPAQPSFGPPPGWSISAKAAFDQLPDPVKQAIAHREEEINRGFEKLRDYKGLDSYVQWSAQQYGMPLPQVIDAYRAADDMLRQDFYGGVLNLFQQYNADPVQWAQAILQQAAPPPTDGSARPVYDPRLMQEIAALKQQVSQFQAETSAQKEARIIAEIEEFARQPEHRFFDNVSDDMTMLIRTGKAADLKEAYAQACRLNPEVFEILVNERIAKHKPAIPQQGRSPAAGSPVEEGGSKTKKNRSLRDDLLAAWDEFSPNI